MPLALYYHPLASFCHKVLLALYENATPFDGRSVDFANEAESARFLSLWPVGKIPVLRDEARDRMVPEKASTMPKAWPTPLQPSGPRTT